jgi:signal peptidase I
MRRAGRLVAVALCWAALGIVMGTALVTGAPRLVGYTSLTVLSGSMEPVIGTGDVVVGRPIAAGEARRGDIITFREPGTRRLVTHRLRRVRVRDGVAQMVTKGDANNAPERWRIPLDGRVSRVLYRIPELGYTRSLVGSPLGRLLLLVLPVLLLGVLELKRIWRSAGGPDIPHAATPA